MVLHGVVDFAAAVGGSDRVGTDDEKEGVGRVDIAKDFLLPLGGEGNVLPVNPGFAVADARASPSLRTKSLSFREYEMNTSAIQKHGRVSCLA